MSVLELVRQKEDNLRANRFESAFAVDVQGTVLLDKTGEQYELRLTYAERERMYMAQGVIFTHNHPRGWDYPVDDPRRAGSSFSPEDLQLACEVELTEMRVVTPRFRYSIKPPPEGWSWDYWNETLVPTSQRMERKADMELVRKRLRGELTKPEAEMRFWHEVWTLVASELNMVYARSEE